MTPRDRALSITLENGILCREDVDQIEAAIIAHSAELEAENAALKTRAEKWELRFNVRCQQADERDSEISDQFTLVANAEREARLRAEKAEAENARLRKVVDAVVAYFDAKNPYETECWVALSDAVREYRAEVVPIKKVG